MNNTIITLLIIPISFAIAILISLAWSLGDEEVIYPMEGGEVFYAVVKRSKTNQLDNGSITFYKKYANFLYRKLNTESIAQERAISRELAHGFPTIKQVEHNKWIVEFKNGTHLPILDNYH